ncbi:Branched-chain amino acid ABC-type transport system, permease component [Mesotoga infera]|jgi:branched-chain amino acid transport system permease protein|uniref:Branched-chain amino acid ABC-type transport system, permease component n=2 Tax=Mesotoga infera TaxID=1236046 RepID=A0A7Z7LF56_9BACT|nr:Branched-chain amino acid ABC-type transport system, permease component [Mesotoga infera]
MMLQDILQNIVSGASIGATYGLVGLGVVFLWLTISRINFANISSAMLGAYLFYTFYTMVKLGFFLSFVLSVGVIALYGLGLRIFIYEPIRKRGGGRLEFVVATLMLCTFWLNLIIVTYGALPKPFPPVFGGSKDFITIGSIRIPTLYLNIYLVIAALMVLIYFILNKTLIGKSFRAAAQNREAAALMGIDVKVTTSLSFVMATCVVGIAGILLAPIYFVSLELGGGSIGVKGFASAVLGGLTNPYGTILGGISLGLLENFSTLYISSTYRDIISFSVLVAVLILKPSGIFNWKGKKI